MITCWMDRDSDSMMTRLKNYSLGGMGRNFSCLFLGLLGFNWLFSFAQVFQWCCLTTQGSPNVLTSCFCWVLIFALFVIYKLPVMVHGWVRRPPHEPNICFYYYGSWGRGLGFRKVSSPIPSPPHTQFITDRSKAALSLWYFLLIVTQNFTF